MSKEEVLERALRSYMAYYDVERETPEEPFCSGSSLSFTQQHLFSHKIRDHRRGRINEYVFFALADRLDEELFRKLNVYRLGKGLARVKPHAITGIPISPRRYRLFRHGSAEIWPAGRNITRRVTA